MDAPSPLSPDISSPWLNCAGCLGFLPPPSWNWPQPAGAFITPPISRKPRTPAESRAALDFAGGCLLHSGLPNRGLRAVFKTYAARWARLELPVWVHLIAEYPEDVSDMIRACEGLENVLAVEIGLPPNASPQECLHILDAAAGELPLVANLPLERAGESWLMELAHHGVGALSLGAPRGILPRPNDKTISGRLYGPALLPLALAAVRRAARIDLPIIASGGVFSPADGQALLQAGAWAVALDTVLWNPQTRKI